MQLCQQGAQGIQHRERLEAAIFILDVIYGGKVQGQERGLSALVYRVGQGALRRARTASPLALSASA